MKSKMLTIPALALSLGLASPMAYAQAELSSVGNEIEASLEKAKQFWSNATANTDVVFNIPGLTTGQTVDWAIPYTTDGNFMGLLAEFNDEFRKAVQNPPKLSELETPITKPTPAVTDDGIAVVALPFNDYSVGNGTLTLDQLGTGTTINVPGSDEILTRMAAAMNSLNVLYSTENGTGTGYDSLNAAAPAIATLNETLSYANSENAPLSSDGNPLVPNARAEIEKAFRVINSTGEKLTSRLQALVPTSSEKLDKKDGNEDGLTPITDDNGKPVVSEQAVDSGDVEQTIGFRAPDEGNPVFLIHQLLDKNGRIVGQETIDTLEPVDAMMEVQASTENANAQLSDGQQLIYNQAQINQLTPGHRYQVLVNLYKCTAPGECDEVAAVNREIIPTETVRTENFSVEIDASTLADGGTYEWTTQLFEGTGDLYNMGKRITSVDDHPASQVLSKSGTQKAHGSKETNVAAKDTSAKQQHAATVPLAKAQTDESDKDGDRKQIGDKQPPASMEEVRANNEELRNKTPWWKSSGFITAAVIAGIGALAAAFGLSGRKTSEKPQTKA